MSNRLDQEREERLTPIRIDKAKEALSKLKNVTDIMTMNGATIFFTYNGNTIQYHAYSGWASGKGIQDGRGLLKLIAQLK